MAYFPMFVDMTERECLIVGGGNVAYRKVSVMLDFGAKVTVVAEYICDELRKLTIDDRPHRDCGTSGAFPGTAPEHTPLHPQSSCWLSRPADCSSCRIPEGYNS